MTPTRPLSLRRVAMLLTSATAITAVLGTAACSGGSSGTASTTPPPPATSSATEAPTPAPTHQAVDPLTGGRPSKNGVVAAKIDDTGNGRPQRNVDKADIVYIEEVEGGLTRLVGVFHTALPKVEAVRSTRPNDPELLAQYGPIAYVASGGARVPLQILNRSNLKTAINDRGNAGFERDPNRPVPYNLVANLASIAKRLKAPRPKDVGFHWASGTGQIAHGSSGKVVSTVVGGTPVTFRYRASLHRYVRYIDGRAQHTAGGKLITTPNVLVQFCKVTVFTRDRDVLGNPNKFTHTVGSGKVVLFRDGKRLAGTWKRSGLKQPTSFRTGGGAAMRLRPGGAWVVLTRNNAPLH